MSEVIYALKAFVIALAIVFLMQAKIGTATVESHAEDWLRTSSVALYLQGVSGGAVLAIKNASQVTTDFVASKFGRGGEGKDATKNSRLNFEPKRSQEANK